MDHRQGRMTWEEMGKGEENGDGAEGQVGDQWDGEGGKNYITLVADVLEYRTRYKEDREARERIQKRDADSFWILQYTEQVQRRLGINPERYGLGQH